MRRFLLLLRPEEANLPCLSKAENDELFNRFIKWTESLQQGGHLAGVERLTHPGDGKTVRRRGEQLVVDGPFAEVKEAVTGLYILAAENLEHACLLAQGCPLVQLGGSIEVREIDWFPKPAS